MTHNLSLIRYVSVLFYAQIYNIYGMESTVMVTFNEDEFCSQTYHIQNRHTRV